MPYAQVQLVIWAKSLYFRRQIIVHPSIQKNMDCRLY
jgi:hypothetical protein